MIKAQSIEEFLNDNPIDKNGHFTKSGEHLSDVSDLFFKSKSGIKSLKGCPSSISGTIYISDNLITSYEGGPSLVDKCLILGSNKLNTFKHLPKHISESINLNNNAFSTFTDEGITVGNDCLLYSNHFISLHNIQKCFKSIGRVLNLLNNPIQSSILGVFLIENLQSVYFPNPSLNHIINTYLRSQENRKRQIYKIAQQLIKDGYPKFAKL